MQGLLCGWMGGRNTLDQLFWGHLTAFDQSGPKIGGICGKSGLISSRGGTMGAMIGVGKSNKPRGVLTFWSIDRCNFTPDCNFMLLFGIKDTISPSLFKVLVVPMISSVLVELSWSAWCTKRFVQRHWEKAKVIKLFDMLNFSSSSSFNWAQILTTQGHHDWLF